MKKCDIASVKMIISKKKKKKSVSVAKDMEELECLTSVSGNGKLYNCYRKKYGNPSKYKKSRVTICDRAIFLPNVYAKQLLIIIATAHDCS